MALPRYIAFFFQRKLIRRMCGQCGYSLIGLPWSSGMCCPECGSLLTSRDMERGRAFPSVAAILLWCCALPVAALVVCFATLGAVLCGADRHWMEFGAKSAAAFIFGAPFCLLIECWALSLWWAVTPRALRKHVMRRALVVLAAFVAMVVVMAVWCVAAFQVGGIAWT